MPPAETAGPEPALSPAPSPPRGAKMAHSGGRSEGLPVSLEREDLETREPSCPQLHPHGAQGTPAAGG